jgi:hypothetical protein
MIAPPRRLLRFRHIFLHFVSAIDRVGQKLIRRFRRRQL